MPLPVYEIADDLKSHIASNKAARVLLKAPTGSGKSTEVPGMLLESGVQGMVVVIQPRRMAARLLAGWVAGQRRSKLGEEVGYAVRFDSRYKNHTRILYLTDGLFQRWLQDDPELTGVGAVIFDEFHERRLASDIALARCLDLQDSKRSDLRLVVMSATLDTGNLEEYLQPVRLLEAGGRTHPVDIIHLNEGVSTTDRSGNRLKDMPIWDRVAKACKQAITQDDCGNLLVFLPGAYEIRRTVETLKQSTFSGGWDILPLYSSLSSTAQEAAITPGPKPKIICSTNVAETSLTIDGVRTVIDSGLARIASYDGARGINTLHIEPISRAASDQRAGRAGRIAPGRAYRLWSENSHACRKEFESPEIERIDLSEAMLLLTASGVSCWGEFRWLTPPPPEASQRAQQQLHHLAAVDRDGQLTEDGAQMANLPLEPRFARLMLAGQEHGCVAEAAFIAAAVQSEGLFSKSKYCEGRKHFTFDEDHSDFAAEWRGFESAEAMQFDPKRCQQVGVMARAAREIAKGHDRLLGIAKRFGWKISKVDFAANHRAVGHAMLAAFSDQLAVRQSPTTLACRLVGQRKGKLDASSSARKADAFVAAEITEVGGHEVTTHLNRATAIELDWLETQLPEDIGTHSDAAWDDTHRCVVSRNETRFRDLVIESKESQSDVNLDRAAEILAQKVIAGELLLKKWDHSVQQWIERLKVIGPAMPELEMPGWTNEDKQLAIAQICHGAVRYKQIKDKDPWPVLREWLNAAQRSALDTYCPTRVKLANDQNCKITYDADKGPWISIKVAHLFGVWQTPTLCEGRVPIVVHVLNPAQRPWQMTKDLESFWENGYPQMRKELAGRYPKHPWPQDPKSYTPPIRRK